MRLLKRLIPKLKEYFAADEFQPLSEIRIDLNKIPGRKYLRDFFEGYGYKIIE
jgi:hypothetical protein